MVNCSIYTNKSGWGREKYNEIVVVKGEANNFSFDFSYDGAYIWNVECVDDDSMSAFNSTNRTVFVDGTLPFVEIVSPAAANYSFFVMLNFSFNESNPDSCFYSLNGGSNVTIETCANGTVLSGLAQGLNNVSLCMNDSAGNFNCTDRDFWYDSVAPQVIVMQPENISYNYSEIFVNITMNEDADACSYDMGYGNVTMNGSKRNYNGTILAEEGVNWLLVYCNDSAGNMGINDSLFFTVDSLVKILLLNPPDLNYSKNSTIIFEYIPDDEGSVVNCSIYTNKSGWGREKYNEIVVVKGEANNFSFDFSYDGAYIWNVECVDDDSMSAFNSTNRTVFVDGTLPFVEIVSPAAANYSFFVMLNFSFNESNPDSCFYSLNGGSNVTIETCANGTVLSGLAQGLNNVSLCMNDSAGNFNCTDRDFWYDSVASAVDIVAPENRTYNQMWVWVNVTTDGSYWCGVSLNGTQNVSLLNKTALLSDEWYLNLSVGAEGANNVTVYCNDSVGNMNHSQVEFAVNTTEPVVLLDSPHNAGNVTYSSVMFNYTPAGVDIANCTLYGNFSGDWEGNASNSTLVLAGSVNDIEVNLSSGFYLWNVMCEDGFSNAAFAGSNYTVTVDFDAPNISVVMPLNGSSLACGTTWVWVNVSTDEDAVCRYNLSNSSFDFDADGVEFNVTSGVNHSFNYSVLSDGGEYIAYYKCRDLFLNVNEDVVGHRFFVAHPCVDNDGDGYGVGTGCLGADCDDSNPSIHTGCYSGSGSPGSSPVILVLEDDEDVVNETDDVAREAVEEIEENDTGPVNETNWIDEEAELGPRGKIYADILELKDAVHLLKSGNKISENVSMEYLSRLKEVMGLYQAGEFEDAQAAMDEIRTSLDYENETVAVDEGEDGVDYGFLAGLCGVVAALMVIVAVAGKIGNRKKCLAKEYIKLCLDKGFSRDDIKRKMVESGWSEEGVDKAMRKVKK